MNLEGKELVEKANSEELELMDQVVFLNRVAKVVKGGKNFKFTALVVVGDGKGVVGFGLGKAREVPDAIKKAVEHAKKHLMRVPLSRGTIPHPVVGRYCSSKVLLKPAVPGTGVIAGGPVRAVVDLAGIKDVLSKSLGSNNPVNVVKATVKALSMLRSIEEEAELRGKVLSELIH